MEKLKNIKLTKERIMLGVILILSGILNFGNLSIQGYANQYYAAGVKSMTTSLKNFFFVSFDPTGFVTIDKPPLGFMIQAISAKIFGYSGWSIILPQALAGLISVGLIYHLVKKSFGTAAGLISGLALAVTPVFVADSKSNTCDNLLVLALLLACVALTKAAEKGKLSYLLISTALIGVGFNIKMLQAYMVAPAIYLTYLISKTVSVKKRILHLILSTVLLVVVSFAWAFIVDLVPTTDRPFVGSSTNNTEMELIIGHNGLERLGLSSSSSGGPGGQGGPSGEGGQMQPPGQDGSNSEMMQSQSGSQSSDENISEMQTPPDQDGDNSQMQGGPNGSQDGQGGPSGQGGPGGGQSNGQMGGQGTAASITRLFTTSGLSDQIIWLFPIAFIGFIAAAIQEKLKLPIDNERKKALVLWFAWLVPVFAYFSFTTGLYHPYYLTMLAPPISALFGIGTVSMWNLYKEGGWKAWFLPVALASDGAVEVLLLSSYSNSINLAKILIILVAILCFGSAIVFAILNLIKKEAIKLKRVLAAVALIGLLIAPTVSSGTTLFYTESGTFPSAGFSLMSGEGQGGPGMGGSSSDSSSSSKLIDFLLKNKTNEKYILVTSSTNGNASEIIIKTDESVMALGGFFGTDKVITLDEFKELAKNGEIRYVMTGGQGGGSSDIMNWVKEVGTLVDSSEWSDSSSDSDNQEKNQMNGNKEESTQSNKTSNSKSSNEKASKQNSANRNSNSGNKSNSTQNSETENEMSKDGENSAQGGQGFGGMDSGSLYDLKAYTDSQK
ncbi:glycosyltransferase family 39 protein [Clostridium sp. SHJSY1]|uniref:glycosyltransferase family 39 protein n=1 Tax=Clostridium sp. SHJSY1 TaxID=2942483 RepID=UPI002876490F|nr:glycosyltransferase family 39 protein [Clostridium sp. SHJSY1]MDS0526131.1 glycosyltransferase family 39 protein [Clostridium sp. SHJSY1]